MSRNICPECDVGKHQNCDGGAWDFDADEPTSCDCSLVDHDTGRLRPGEVHDDL